MWIEGKAGLLYIIIVNYLWIFLRITITCISKYLILICAMIYQELYCFQALWKKEDNFWIKKESFISYYLQNTRLFIVLWCLFLIFHYIHPKSKSVNCGLKRMRNTERWEKQSRRCSRFNWLIELILYASSVILLSSFIEVQEYKEVILRAG